MIERDGLTAEQASAVFQEEMVRYRNMLAYQHQLIQQDGKGDVAERFAQMRAIYGAVNRDFADNGFSDFLGIDYVGGFDRRFADLDDEARVHLYAMLGRAPDLPEHLLNEARDLLRRVGIEDSGDRSRLPVRSCARRERPPRPRSPIPRCRTWPTGWPSRRRSCGPSAW